MATLKIVLPIDEQEALQILAQRELRDPRAQAVLLIRDGLQRYGLLSANAAALQAQAIEKEAGNAAANEAGVRV